MKKRLSYLIYYGVTIAVTFVLHLIPMYYISMMRFSAADRSPIGDITLGEKLMFSVGFPVFYLVCITIAFFLYRSLMAQFGIELKKILPICFNIFITLCLLVRFTYFAFDYSFF